MATSAGSLTLVGGGAGSVETDAPSAAPERKKKLQSDSKQIVHRPSMATSFVSLHRGVRREAEALVAA